MADRPTSNSSNASETPRIFVCQYRSCTNNGSEQTLQAFREANLEGVEVEGCGCLGQCSSGPTVRVAADETWYCQVQPEDVPHIVQQHLRDGQPVEDKLNPRIHLRIG
ncbi:(2Fe-2S) ferredoxin domain-containing protein [Baaleninema sp.]|uniref:(2Fe-2S) ferredoxin domain-containing protein n=1 Tax=Baaleninema sp. TaxID=3101197 RepID=UPI003CFD8015